MANEQRSRLVIEPEIQYALVRQLCAQWLLHLAASAVLLVMLQVLLGGFFRPWSEHWGKVWPLVASVSLSMLVLLPAFVRSSLKLSNRFVGPIHRFRGELRLIASGKPYEPMKFRNADYWPTLARELDAAVDVIRPSLDSAAGDSTLAPGGGIVIPSDPPQTPDTPTS